MDLSILKLQDPPPIPPHGERRSRVRHKLHTPVYASFSGPHTGMVLDLSELLDVHEDGFSVQTSEVLEVNRPLNICLDLSETKNYIHASGHVVWSDSKGRGGVRFSPLADDSLRHLKEWLFVNALIACTHRSSRTAQLSQQEEPAAVAEMPSMDPREGTLVPDLSEILAAVEAVRKESRALAADLDAVLQLISERAVSLTGADGAALAFMTDGELICRARSGDPAPPLGARVDAAQGFSGECIRQARIISCDDTETDLLVNREICRSLGIGSILAAPIVADFRVVGLIEVFSSRPKAFAKLQETTLERLIEIIPKSPVTLSPALAPPPTDVLPPTSGKRLVARQAKPPLAEPETEAQEPLAGVGVRPFHLLLLILAVGFAALALGYVLAPTIEKHWLAKEDRSPSVVAASEIPPPPRSVVPAIANTISQLRTMAESGDPGAQYELGARYHKGDGVPQSETEAVKWFLRAAEQGHVVSQAMLGYFYWVGQGVPRDIPKAYFWSVLARAGGDEASKYRVESMAVSMTRAQAAAIQQEADTWLHEHTTRTEQSKK